MLTRICLDDPGTAATLESSGLAVTALARRGLMAMVEPFLTVRREPTRVANLLDPDSVISSIHVAAGLGATSAHTWLKLPVVEEMDRVLDATTLPCLLLGGDPTGDPADTLAEWDARGGRGRKRRFPAGTRRAGLALVCTHSPEHDVGEEGHEELPCRRCLLYQSQKDSTGLVKVAQKIQCVAQPYPAAP